MNINLYRRNLNVAIPVIISAITLNIVPYLIGNTSDKAYNHLIYIALFYGLYRFYSMAIMCINIKRITTSIPVAIIFAISYTLGNEFEKQKTIEYLSWNSIWIFISLCLISVIVMTWFLSVLDRISNNKIYNNKLAVFLMHRKTGCLIICSLLLLFWIPTLMVLYPGVFSIDATHQATQVFELKRFDNHHPITHTLFINACLLFGKYVFGNINLGVALSCIIQIVILAIACWYACHVIYKNYKSNVAVLVMIILFALSPLNKLMGSIVTKDIFYSAFFLMLFIATIDLITNTEAFLAQKRKKIIYIMLVCLMCLFRNQGIYVFIFLSIFLVVAFKNNRKSITVLCISSIAFYFIVLNCIYFAFNVNKVDSTFGEMLSVPIQQLSRVMVLNPDSISDEEKQIIGEIIPLEVFQEYIPEISDPIKAHFNNNNFKNNPTKYLKVWLKVGTRNPLLYIDSFLYGTYGYWYVDITLPHWGTLFPYDNYAEKFGIEYTSLIPEKLEGVKNNFLYATYQNIPIISTLVSPGLPIILVIMNMSVFIYYGNRKFISGLTLLIGLWGTVMLGPVISVRYAYPLIVCTPLLIVLPFLAAQSNNKNMSID